MKGIAICFIIVLILNLALPSLNSASAMFEKKNTETMKFVAYPSAESRSENMTIGLLGQSNHPTGLKEPTAEGIEWLNDQFPKVTDINLNELALERINQDRRNLSLPSITGKNVTLAQKGGEGTFDFASPEVGAGYLKSLLPRCVDNSQSPAFPPIGDQGSLGSCAAFATTYYQYTYEQNLALGRDASGGNTAFIFSPKWTYNLVNSGVDRGSSPYDIYDVLIKGGAATLSDFPYDNNYREWCLDKKAWRNAINYKLSDDGYGQLSEVNKTNFALEMKAQLLNGRILTTCTYVFSWYIDLVDDDASSETDDSFVGQYIAVFQSSDRRGSHAITIVGYNDNVWCDINANGIVEAEEKGAFKIANSWGKWWGNGGFCWVTYDAMWAISQVPSTLSWPPTDRNADYNGIFGVGCFITAQSYQPKMFLEYTIRGRDRSQVKAWTQMGEIDSVVAFGLSKKVTLLSGLGGHYSFDGTQIECEMTIVTDCGAPLSVSNRRWSLYVDDMVQGNVTTIQSCSLYQVTDGGDLLVGWSSVTPRIIDSSSTSLGIDYQYDSFNISPIACMEYRNFQGNEYVFNGSGSFDPDGQVVSYQWNFGDGSSGDGPLVSHSYLPVGNYRVWLTVTDLEASQGTNTTYIVCNTDRNPTTVLSVTEGPVGTEVTVTGTIRTFDGHIGSTWESHNDWPDMVLAVSRSVGFSYSYTIVIPDDYPGSYKVTVMDLDAPEKLYSHALFTVRTSFSLSFNPLQTRTDKVEVTATVTGWYGGTDAYFTHLRFRILSPDGSPIPSLTVVRWGLNNTRVGKSGLISRIYYDPLDDEFSVPGEYTVLLDYTLGEANYPPEQCSVASGKFTVLSSYVISGRILYNGQPLSDFTQESTSFWVQNEFGSVLDNVNSRYDNSTSEFGIRNLPSGEYLIHAIVDDAPPFNKELGYPLDYYGWIRVSLSENSTLASDLAVWEIIHLIEPFDNQQCWISSSDPQPVLSSTLQRISWDAVPEAHHYLFRIGRYEGLSFLGFQTQINITTTTTEVNLPSSLEGQLYSLSIEAYGDGHIKVGELLFHYPDGSCGYAQFLTPRITFNISVTPGWNLVGVPGNLDDARIPTYFGGHLKKVTAIYGYRNGQWSYWIPGFPSTLNNFESGLGYWLLSDGEFNVTASAYGTSSLALQTGWNLVAVTSDREQSVEFFLDGVSSASVYGFDESAKKWEYNIEGVGGSLTVLTPGEGYWVLVGD